jgi:hypothetical protein
MAHFQPTTRTVERRYRHRAPPGKRPYLVHVVFKNYQNSVSQMLICLPAHCRLSANVTKRPEKVDLSLKEKYDYHAFAEGVQPRRCANARDNWKRKPPHEKNA